MLAAGLALSLVSSVAIAWAYTWQHDAASGMEHLSVRHPVRAARLLLRDRGWVIGLGLETGGWLLYAAALRLAPLALVQGISAGGIAVLALLSVRGRPSLLSGREQLAVALAVVGLLLVSLSLVGVQVSDKQPRALATVLWLIVSAAVAVALWVLPLRIPKVAALGLASGFFFANGDICLKLAVGGGWWIAAGVPMIAVYALGTLCMQSAFQHGDALTGAGLATLATNALPIAAGFVLFGESLPSGARGVAQVAGFAVMIGSAILLADKRQQPEATQAAFAPT
jgi:hypothetical protein